MPKMNYTVARVQTRTRDSIGKYERHNERKNEYYQNTNVDLSQTHNNVHFKSCGDITYNEYLDKLVAEGKVSLRGLKKDAKVFDEMILDVNTDYFEEHGGYEFAKEFYAEAYRFAQKVYGEENIISAVMHADELNLVMSDAFYRPIYHYHLHIVALPVVKKDILWSKRRKDKSLVGTVKETVNQISHSKKWKSPPALDDNGNQIPDINGKPVLIPTYSILQDEFFEHMQKAGFKDFQRGERGSNEKYKTCLQYQIDKDKERLSSLQTEIKKANEKLSTILPVQASNEAIDNMGKKTFTGKVQMSNEDYTYLTNLAKECLVSRKTVSILESNIAFYKEKVEDLKNELYWLKEKCRPFLDALKIAPQKVMGFINKIIEPKYRLVEKEPDDLPKKKDIEKTYRQKKKSKGDMER